MKAAAVEIWVWVLIYGGLLLLCLALFVARDQGALGWAIGVVGSVLTALGVLLIVVRSRMRD
jgi:hypothetical protein